MGFFTDTSVCIGCKACEVACKEWNAVPEDGLMLTGCPTTTPPASARRPGGTWRSSSSRRRRDDRPGGRVALAHVLRRVQALHRRRLPGRLPDRGAVAHRVRHGRGPGGHLQRLRLLRLGLPVRRHRRAARTTAGVEVHAVLRPARRRPDAGLRQGLPHRVDPVRAARRAAERAQQRVARAARPGVLPRPGCTGEPSRWRRRRRAPSSCCWTSPRCTACRRIRS